MTNWKRVKCPDCQTSLWHVMETREVVHVPGILRRRIQCSNGHRFSTYAQAETGNLVPPPALPPRVDNGHRFQPGHTRNKRKESCYEIH